MKKFIALIVLLSFLSVGSAKKLGLKFDTQGKLVGPDDYLVHQALIDDEDGYKNDAMWRFKEAAEYGNKHGQYYAGLLYLQKDDYINGYAWLKLAGDQFMNNANLLPGVTHELKKRQQVSQADEALNVLKQTINFESTIAKRINWFKRIKFAGSHIGGYIPIFWETRLFDGFSFNGPRIKGWQLRKEINAYLFEYRYQKGDVRLKEIQLAENM